VIGRDLSLAAELLRQGKIVGIPTETVYGLAANALDPVAVTKIFEAKNRPSFDPLIIHVDTIDKMRDYVIDIPKLFEVLIEKYCPGPLTFLLEKKSIVPDLVTSGSNYVAVRIPNHPVTLSLLSSLDFPLAAPSANPFGYISPTTSEHVSDQLAGSVDYILDGGPCDVGIESTIIGMEEDKIVVFRKGGFDPELIRQETDLPIQYFETSTSNPQAPGMLSAHYAPHRQIIVGDLEVLLKKIKNTSIGVICFNKGNRIFDQAEIVLDLSSLGSLSEAARSLFGHMRSMDRSDVDVILAEFVPNTGIGMAINDRLRRASYEEKDS
jgi:L-threonylcarbamoyladenylate synthase